MNAQSYAMQADPEEDRIYPEREHSYRDAFVRDRDRVVYSHGFRRLAYKTQVFTHYCLALSSEWDLYRTRLTHSLEVAQISRSAANFLALNEPLTECLALAHDIGHSPFGHAGEKILNEIMSQQYSIKSGFEHNCQTLRQLSVIEKCYIDFPGLNLSKRTLISLMKHSRVYDCDHHLLALQKERLKQKHLALEASLVDFCDRVAYLHHDLEDGIATELLDLEEVIGELEWCALINKELESRYKGFSKENKTIRARTILRAMLDKIVTNLVEKTKANLSSLSKLSEGDISSESLYDLELEKYPLEISDFYRGHLKKLHSFLLQSLYRHKKVLQMSEEAEQIITVLFRHYSKGPEKLPLGYRQRIESSGLSRSICDYIAGMTDRFAKQIYNEL